MIGRIAGSLSVAIVLLAFAGPLFAGPPDKQVDGPYAPPSADRPLGTDGLGRDVLDRVLHGGWTVVGLALGATALATALGVLLGVALGMARHRVSEIAMRVIDMLLVLPPLLLLLLLATGMPGNDGVVLLAVALITTPISTRVTRAATRRLAHAGYVEVALARGDSRWQVLRHDVLPGIARTVLAEAGLRFVTAVSLTATAGFLGLGRPAPAANWGRMVAENIDGASLAVWPFLVPALLLVLFTVSINLLADTVADRLAGGAR
ncbi:peptide/nickel transport system permease protein [Herbihabitans rhizosphaerae]|uniref:Peptide/nickel transport system permease protein n=1 Tax=Herbihabitans rhizosphaerae TaxID=1872711 RepID=A0A4Q7L8P0_9PSEU|nr:ABC transporter permease [Herbihabitans rhizosphaerae]RZS45031.1 peptide/nickel transport system permease protein [Herbihabitans rhizosphaerae]